MHPLPELIFWDFTHLPTAIMHHSTDDFSFWSSRIYPLALFIISYLVYFSLHSRFYRCLGRSNVIQDIFRASRILYDLDDNMIIHIYDSIYRIFPR